MIDFPSKVVVIDDSPKEAKPLITALHSRGTSTLYYSGNLKDLPPSPLSGVRLLFLDLRLSGLDGQPIAAVKSAMVGVIKKTISTTNGPYLIIAWTKHPEDMAEVAEALYGLDVRPVLVVGMSKDQCRPNKNKPFVLDLIRTQLEAKMQEIGAAALLLRWESIVQEAASDVARELCSVPGSIPANVAALMNALAKASVGKIVEDLSNESRGREAMFAMSGMFNDTLEKRICAAEGINLDPLPSDANGEVDQSDLNTKLLMSSNVDATHRPGLAFHSHEEDPAEFVKVFVRANLQTTSLNALNNQEVNAIIQSGQQLSTANQAILNKKNACEEIMKEERLFSVIITAYCDQSQKKEIRPKVCSGLLWPEEHICHLQMNSDSAYVTPILKLSEPVSGKFHFVLDLRTVDGCKKSALHSPVFSLRRELVLDIQNKLARQMSRPGITAVS